jgi:uncharacterized protein
MTRYYSCDSHVVEPRHLFEGKSMEERFGDRAPRFVRESRGRTGDFLMLPGAPPVSIGRLGIAGNKLDDPNTDRLIELGYGGVNPGAADPAERLKEQERDGIVGEVMYPSANMWTFALTERDVVHEIFQRHNTWVAEYSSHAPDRLIGIGCLPLPDVDEAVAELERAVALGVRGLAIPAAPPVDRPYHHPDYDPFWAAANNAGIPLTMHSFTGCDWNMGLPSGWGIPSVDILGYTLQHAAVAASIANLIVHGVVEKYPNLKIVAAEFETGWVAHFKQRLDHAVYRARDRASDTLSMKPSEYFDRNFWVTFEDDVQGLATRYDIGVANLLWGNDYPHHDSIWPNSMATLDRIMDGVPESEVEQMTFGNVVELYDIDVDKLP